MSCLSPPNPGAKHPSHRTCSLLYPGSMTPHSLHLSLQGLGYSLQIHNPGLYSFSLLSPGPHRPSNSTLQHGNPLPPWGRGH